MATFSVIVPVYNAAHTIERCVSSIAASGGDDVQIILIEDCSKDNSLEVCRRLAARYGTVLLLHNTSNRGVSYTRNRGLDAATGKYLLFVDSDDHVAEGYVSAFRSAIDAGGSFSVCGYINHDEKQNGRTDTFAWQDFEGTRTLPLAQVIEKLYQDRLLQQLWNKVFLTETVREHGIRFDETISIGEDTRFILDYILAGGQKEITLINQPLYHYMRDQDGSLMFRVGYESVEEPLKNLRKLYAIMGLSEEERDQRLLADRQKQIESYAYLIMHNAGMSRKEKKRLILALDASQGKPLWQSNQKLFIKEKLCKSLKRGILGIKKCIPLWVKAPIAILINEVGKWPAGLVLAHMYRSFAESGGCGKAGRIRAYKAVQNKTYLYLKKHYQHLIHNRNFTLGEATENAPIWVFWWQGEENAPILVQRCIQSLRNHSNGHPVYVIDQTNYLDFLSIPSHIENKRKNGTISLTHFSDYLRMALLAKHGGLWLDATIYVSADLQLAFREPIFTVRNPGLDNTNISNWNWSGFALGCQKQFALPCMVLDLFNAYWNDHDHLIDYFLIDYMIRLVYDSSELIRKCINDIPCNNSALYFYQENFNFAAEGKNSPSDTWLYKLSWKGQYRTHTEEGLETVYGQWLRETGEMLCQK